MDDSQRAQILAQLPYLRRYARASTGSQQAGDALVKSTLEALVADRDPVSDAAEGTRLALFRCFHNVRNRLGVPTPVRGGAGGGPGDLVQRRVEEKVGALPVRDRDPLLLVHTEGFSRAETALILGVSEAEVEARLAHAWQELKQEARVRVLIIEDEPVIALDIAGIVADMGHHVAGVATRSGEAVALAASEKPDLVLADIQLEDGNTGIAAVAGILRNAPVPVVFVTAFPERLLTGERVEPAFIVSKPFDPEVLQIAVSQALFCAARTG